jgi:hypothetical protein
MPAETRGPRASPASYAVEVAGKLSRREAEAIAVQIRGLARRHHLTVIGLKVRARARVDPP